MTSSATFFISDARVAVWIWSVEYIRIQTLSRVDLTQASLPDDVEDVRLADARFEYTIPDDQHISSKDIVPEATLDVGDFSDADLSGACLIAIDLSDENLSSADLFDFPVFNAILSDADLSGVNLLNTNLEERSPITDEAFFHSTDGKINND